MAVLAEEGLLSFTKKIQHNVYSHQLNTTAEQMEPYDSHGSIITFLLTFLAHSNTVKNRSEEKDQTEFTSIASVNMYDLFRQVTKRCSQNRHSTMR